MKFFRKIFYDCFTGKRDDIFDLHRFLLTAACIVFFILAIYQVIKTGVFDPEKFGIGFGALVAGGGAAMWFKKGTGKGD